jgi:hypothetical protein
MALPVPNTTLAKKKKPLDDLDELANARMGAAKSETAVEAVAKPVAESARQAKTYTPRQQDPAVGMSEQQLARKAALDELEAGKAQALQDASARAGAGGFGLSGATAALQADIGRTQDRNKVLTMAEFDQRAKDQQFTDVQRRAALDDLESAADIDYNDDGMIMGQKVGGKIGDGDVENNPATGTQKERESVDNLVANLPTSDYSWWDTDAEPGSIQEPYAYPGSFEELKAWYEANAPEALPLKMTRQDTGQPGKKVIVYTDKNGKSYVATEMSSYREPVATATATED